jgi:uncharacterized membrane protein YgcG
MLWSRIKDRLKLYSALTDAGYSVPHHEEEKDEFNSTVDTLMAAPLSYSAFETHFDASAASPSIDTGSTFDAGGGMSGGGGADGTF